MRNVNGFPLKHVVFTDDRGEVELVRYQGTPKELVVIDGSVCPDDVGYLMSALQAWAADPERFWEPLKTEEAG